MNRLSELDSWYRRILPTTIATRMPSFIDKNELIDLCSWKMKRGTYRARNLALVKSNSHDSVKESSRLAFTQIPDLRKPVTTLCGLAGVGPATASGVLAAFRPDLFPFFDEDVAKQIPGLGSIAFTPTWYQNYADALRRRAASLASPWNAHSVGQALWAQSIS